MTEMFTIQRYLQHNRLEELGMTQFDSWASRFGETVTALELAPEGTGYRARTRFARFFNLPELMNLFKEVADIKTADQLNLTTPEVEYHTIASKPTAIQQTMVRELSARASRVHNGEVTLREDNMLKITTDGRKLGMDQRIINPLLPDEEGTKVNRCVANILQIWRDGQEEKLTQLVFSDISTPKAVPSKRSVRGASGKLDNPILNFLENTVPLPDPEPPFSIYNDIREKLIAGGIPPEQIAFIHDANTEIRKKELFAKVCKGQIRVLIGSTQKMGAGTNIQDRLIALHDLDCPWRPRDLTQRKGRIERRGNMNEKVHVFRYVTEATFDAYLWQTIEKKQNFISQIMTSKSPVRSCEDIDETALSYAEIKALCTGDPRIKERMELDMEVSKLKIMKADHQSQQFRMEDNVTTRFPADIRQNQEYIAGIQADMKTLDEHPHPPLIVPAKKPEQDGGTDSPSGETGTKLTTGFAGMTVNGETYNTRAEAGTALLDACKAAMGDKSEETTKIGTYRGFSMTVKSEFASVVLTLKGQMSHRVELKNDIRGNLIRIDNELDKMPERLAALQVQLDNLFEQMEAAKAEIGKPFPLEDELQQKSARLTELDVLLDIDSGKYQEEQEIPQSHHPQMDSEDCTAPIRVLPDPVIPDGDKPSIRQALKSFSPPAPAPLGQTRNQKREETL